MFEFKFPRLLYGVVVPQSAPAHVIVSNKSIRLTTQERAEMFDLLENPREYSLQTLPCSSANGQNQVLAITAHVRRILLPSFVFHEKQI